jgi:hypothetical protein
LICVWKLIKAKILIIGRFVILPLLLIFQSSFHGLNLLRSSFHGRSCSYWHESWLNLMKLVYLFSVSAKG